MTTCETDISLSFLIDIIRNVPQRRSLLVGVCKMRHAALLTYALRIELVTGLKRQSADAQADLPAESKPKKLTAVATRPIRKDVP